MTSQIILGNGHGIALASDSAVTMGKLRTYDTSEKIYPLAFPHCIAVLHAGNVLFHGMPYTTIINEWARSLGNVPLRTVPYYVENFRKYLVDRLSSWVTDQDLARDFIRAMSQEFERIHQILKQLEIDQQAEKVHETWQEEVDRLDRLEDEASLSPSHQRWADKVFNQLLPTGAYGELWSISELIEYWFTDIARSEEIDWLIKRYVWLSISKHYPTSEETSALLTFTGYGSEVMVPCYVSLEMHGAIDDAIQWDLIAEQYAQRSGSGMFLMNCMGQRDSIDLFLFGYDENLVRGTKAAVSDFLYKSDNAIEERLAESSTAASQTSIDQAIEGSVREFSEMNYFSAIRGTIAGMPLDSLTNTARRLIDIQCLSLDLRGRLPTVGGPVRSARITKSHGFEWVNA